MSFYGTRVGQCRTWGWPGVAGVAERSGAMTERKARPKVYTGQSARRAWAMEAARLGNAGTGALVAVFFATSVTGPERAGRNIIASRDVAISTTTDDQLSWRFALLGFIAKDVTAGRG
jgi:hypothetical protein